MKFKLSKTLEFQTFLIEALQKEIEAYPHDTEGYEVELALMHRAGSTSPFVLAVHRPDSGVVVINYVNGAGTRRALVDGAFVEQEDGPKNGLVIVTSQPSRFLMEFELFSTSDLRVVAASMASAVVISLMQMEPVNLERAR